ncbi:MAG: formate--tetrahydrofolate ligase [Bacilli bacterium]|nr:formate--tetrahydrofolate ligase [Bacilli bacterium]
MDIEIAHQAKLQDISEIAKKLKVEKYLESYGKNKGKIDFSKVEMPLKGKLILTTAISPTPYGEGKTTVSIGLNDALRKLGKNSIAALREPSLGPVFGIKGGATGGGYAQVVPMEEINLHFTGDFHAITSANNLISAAIDNHLYFGNKLSIDPNQICFHRCLDVNDRALRHVKLQNRDESFNITAASEIMSILCLAKDLNDLKTRLGSILIAFNTNKEPIYAKDLKLEGALTVLLKDAIKPNLVQSLENNPIIIHGGPFANIAHGCSSLIATNLGLKVADYVITEAGFGSDLGAEKFFDIKCRNASLKPDAIVLVVTTKALKHQGGITKENIQKESLEGIKKGLPNLEAHLENISKFTKNIVVCLNQYNTDTKAEIEIIQKFVQEKKYAFAITTSYQDGGEGSINLAKEVIKLCSKENDFQLLYPNHLPLLEKIEKLAHEIYHATSIKISDNTKEKLKTYEQMGYQDFPICIAKTQYSISDNPNLLGYPKDYELKIDDVNIYTGAKFVVVYLGNIMTMPGLPLHPNYEQIDIDNKGNIKGLF